MEAFEEGSWQKAFLSIQDQFGIEYLYPEQKEAIKAFIERGVNVFVSLPTGAGKSLIFQSLPIVFDSLFGKPRGSSIVMVISPLKALMKDQVNYLQHLGIPALAIVDELSADAEIIQQVINGTYTHVYGSPECFLSSKAWRGIFSHSDFTSKLVGVAIDEAHCIVQWGLSGNKKIPFRKWFGCLGEMKSLIPINTNFVIVTATATRATKAQIMDSLDIKTSQLYTVEENPNRMNLMYILSYLDKGIGVENIFRKLIDEVQTLHCKTERTLIYCQTRKQCSLLFQMFEVYLGTNMYHGVNQPQNRLVEMFHAGSPQSVKDHVIKNMTTTGSHLRVLITTIAFGMGVNCKEVRRVIHFGPSKNIEQYVQESGRAGRDGDNSTCIILYNGLLATNCETEMKEFLQSEGCRRQELMRNFSTDHSAEITPAHKCCDKCAEKCECGSPECGKHWCLLTDNSEESDDLSMSTGKTQSYCRMRCVNAMQKQELIHKLLEFQSRLANKLDANKYVSCPNILMEFNRFHIKQVVNNCHLLFCLNDVLKHIEIWQKQYAHVILQFVAEVFDDIEYNYPENTSNDNISSLDESINSVWNDIRNDSSFDNTLQTETQQNTIDTEMNDTDMSNVESDTSKNSAIFHMLLQ